MMTSRHNHWFGSGAFATIALVALLESIGDVDDQPKEVKWAVSAISVNLSLAGLAIFANMLLRDKFVGTPIEGGLAVMTFGMWAAVLPAIMDPKHDMATTGDWAFVNDNPNLYFFTWGAAISSFFVLMGFLQDQVEKMGTDVSKEFAYTSWATLTLTSLITMMAASRQFDDMKCKDRDTDVCDRTSFGASLGAVSGLFALAMLGLGCFIKMNIMIDTLMACCLLGAWCFGISYITFGGGHAAAPYISNLYFFTWGCFGIACYLAASGVYKMIGLFMEGEETDAGDEAEKEKDSEKKEMVDEPLDATDDVEAKAGEAFKE